MGAKINREELVKLNKENRNAYSGLVRELK